MAKKRHDDGNDAEDAHEHDCAENDLQHSSVHSSIVRTAIGNDSANGLADHGGRSDLDQASIDSVEVSVVGDTALTGS